MIPNPIHKVLSTFQNCGVSALLMGGQACVFYGGAEFSRDTDWPMIRRLVEADRIACSGTPSLEQVRFWLREARTPELLVELARQFPLETAAMADGSRRLLAAALQGDEAFIEAGLSEEERSERAADRVYWIPLRKELERLRHP